MIWEVKFNLISKFQIGNLIHNWRASLWINFRLFCKYFQKSGHLQVIHIISGQQMFQHTNFCCFTLVFYRDFEWLTWTRVDLDLPDDIYSNTFKWTDCNLWFGMGFGMISDCRISGRYIGKRKKGSYSTKPFVLEAKTAKINNEKYEKINKQVRNKHLRELIRLVTKIMSKIVQRLNGISSYFYLQNTKFSIFFLRKLSF